MTCVLTLPAPDGALQAARSDGVCAVAGPLRQDCLDDATDRELLRRVGGADREAFRELYGRFHQRLSRFLGRLIHREEDIEEAISDALLIVWQRAGEHRDAGRVATWIVGIAYRCALELLQRVAVEATSCSAELAIGAQQADEAMRASRQLPRLQRAFARLSLEQRVVLVLTYDLNCSREDIAAILNWSVAAVTTQMAAARQRLCSLIVAAG